MRTFYMITGEMYMFDHIPYQDPHYIFNLVIDFYLKGMNSRTTIHATNVYENHFPLDSIQLKISTKMSNVDHCSNICNV